MNTSEGIRRIAAAIRWLGDGIGLLTALVFGWAFLAKGGTLAGFQGILLALAMGGIIAGAGRLLSWIINGFAEPR